MQQQLRFATTPAALLLILLVAQSTTHHGVVVLAETNTSTLRRAASTTATAHYHQYQRQRELTASSWINKLYNQVTCTNKKQQSGKCSKSSNSKNSNSSRKGNEDEYENGYAEGYQDGHSDGNDNDSEEEDEEEDHYENGYSSGYQDGYAEGGDSEGEDAIEDSDNEAGESESYLVANNSNNATEDSGHGLWGVGLFLAGVAGLIYFAASVHKVSITITDTKIFTWKKDEKYLLSNVTYIYQLSLLLSYCTNSNADKNNLQSRVLLSWETMLHPKLGLW